ncbi:ferritin-like domain-containing protein [Fuchsiella alkaliacetigena]|uniref:ferritin-like domain-containing protein n=1 Tax=Fuchsiella alkaliacetigena TaxID=957042 RepID=UPI00200B3173|nr:ferritin-like domain-containing protein [Fuchsiella alkaliacetigena]MCK8825304.1 manganese catalase family protein [Fuchsiella alkaliacetigena]
MSKNFELLLDDYAGKVSEVTAVKQYFHHHLVVEEEDVAELLEDVAIEEMKHMDQLGNFLEEAGVDPRIWDAEERYWSGDYVNYQYDVCDILRADIDAELEAILQYYQHIEAISDPQVEMMLNRIIKDELRHIGLFMQKLSKYCSDFNQKSWLRSKIEELPISITAKKQVLNGLQLI